MFVSAVIPLMWLYLTEWFDTGRGAPCCSRGTLVTAIGLTTTAAIILPLLVGAAGVRHAAGRPRGGRPWSLPGGLRLSVAYPIGRSWCSRLVLGGMTATGADDAFFDAAYTYKRTLLFGMVGVISGLALWCGAVARPPAYAGPARRRRRPCAERAVRARIAGVAERAERHLGGALAGAVAARPADADRSALHRARPAPPPALRRAASGGSRCPGRLVRLSPPRCGRRRAGSRSHSRPTWKLPQQRQAIAFWIKGLDRPPVCCSPRRRSCAPRRSSPAEVRVVLPRDFYLVEYDLNSQFAKDRLLLSDFADGTASPAGRVTPAWTGSTWAPSASTTATSTPATRAAAGLRSSPSEGTRCDGLLPAARLSASPAATARP